MELVSLGKIIRRELSRVAMQENLSDGEWGILVHLRRSGGNISQKELALGLGNEPHAVVRVLVNLERSDIVRRVIDPQDARGRLVSLTEEGELQADRLVRLIDDFERDLVSDITEAEMALVLDAFERIRGRLGQEQA